MNLLGAHTAGFMWTDDCATAIQKLANVGVRHFQILATMPHLDLWSAEAQAERINQTLAACGGEVLAVDLTSIDLNLASVDPRVVDFTVECYLRALKFAANVGSRWLCVNSGKLNALLTPPDDRLVGVYRSALERIAAEAKRLNKRIVLENLPGSLFPTAEQTARFLDREDYGVIDVLYDVTNALAAGEEPAHGLDVLKERVRLIHLSDQPNGKWKHDPIGTGDVDFTPIRKRLGEIEYQGLLVIEGLSSTPLEDFLRSRTYLRDRGWRFA